MRIVPAKGKSGAQRDDGTEIIPASDELARKALVMDCSLEEGMDRAVKRAEIALSTLSDNHQAWVWAEVERLRAAHRAYARTPGDEDRRRSFFRAAHDLRGSAASFGYPLVGRLAQSLGRLLSLNPAPPPVLVETLVDALRAMVREGAKDAGDPVGAALAQEFEAMVEKTLRRG